MKFETLLFDFHGLERPGYKVGFGKCREAK